MALPASGQLTLADIQTEFGGTNPIGLNEYYAGAGLVPAATSGTYGSVPSSGQITVQNFYGTSNYVPIYIEDVFSTYLYTGNSSTQTITNGINLAGNGGLVWIKSRSAVGSNRLVTSASTFSTQSLSTNETAGLSAGNISSFNSSGFSLDYVYSGVGYLNETGVSYASWTFRKQPKFFDVVTYTGNGTSNRSISHNLGSVPGCIIIKITNTTSSWFVWHRSATGNGVTGPGLYLDTTVVYPSDIALFAQTQGASAFTISPTESGASIINGTGYTYVAYLFAHDAGGFGLSGTDNVISCGSFTTNASGIATVNLGWEPQFLLVKASGASNAWFMIDSTRSWVVGNNDGFLQANSTQIELSGNDLGYPTATGFTVDQLNASAAHIYIAIRRGPMRVPTSGTSVFTPITYVVSGGGTGL